MLKDAGRKLHHCLSDWLANTPYARREVAAVIHGLGKTPETGFSTELPAKFTIQTDACPTHVFMGLAVSFLSTTRSLSTDVFSQFDLSLLGATGGDPSWQAEREPYAVLVAIDVWCPMLAKLYRPRLPSDVQECTLSFSLNIAGRAGIRVLTPYRSYLWGQGCLLSSELGEVKRTVLPVAYDGFETRCACLWAQVSPPFDTRPSNPGHFPTQCGPQDGGAAWANAGMGGARNIHSTRGRTKGTRVENHGHENGRRSTPYQLDRPVIGQCVAGVDQIGSHAGGFAVIRR
eukprot:1476815-Amphidinium_carterae.2